MTRFRSKRVGEMMLSFLAEEIRRSNDVRVSLVTLLSVDMSRDLSRALIYWTVPNAKSVDSGDEPLPSGYSPDQVRDNPEIMFPDKPLLDTTRQALFSLVPFLRKRVGQELQLRHVPELVFRYDDTSLKAARIDYLLDQIGSSQIPDSADNK